MFITFLYITIIIIIIIKNYIVGKILEIFRKIINRNFPEKYEILQENFPSPHH